MSMRHWHERLEKLAEQKLERRLRVINGPVGPVVPTDDGDKLNFSSNDYLGLASDPRLVRAMGEAALKWGAGAASSRLVSGNTGAHDRLEKNLADYMGTEAAVLFPSGYQANVGAIFALTEPGDAVFSDALVHASLVDGCRLSPADVHVYKHRDTDDLDAQLDSCDVTGLKLVITDSVFSMDGDLAPLREIVEIAERHGALVYVDEAHALGVLGQEGRGLAVELGIADRIAVRVGTFGKAFGTSGAFVATGETAAGLIRSRARSLLYTTAAPAAIAEASAVSIGIVRRADELRRALRSNIDYFVQRAGQLEVPLMKSDTAIQPVVIGPAEHVLIASEQLWQRGIFVQGMRPPTVPQGSSRLRITVTAAHTAEQIDTLVVNLADVLEGIGGES